MVLERIIIEPLDNSSILDELLNFDVKYCKCFDPNIEKKLNKIIRAYGGDKEEEYFNFKIRDIAKMLSKRGNTNFL